MKKKVYTPYSRNVYIISPLVAIIHRISSISHPTSLNLRHVTSFSVFLSFERRIFEDTKNLKALDAAVFNIFLSEEPTLTHLAVFLICIKAVCGLWRERGGWGRGLWKENLFRKQIEDDGGSYESLRNQAFYKMQKLSYHLLYFWRYLVIPLFLRKNALEKEADFLWIVSLFHVGVI